MIKQTLLIFAIPLLTLISCNKEESTYFLQGKIVKGCENLPVKNESFALNIERQKIFKGGSVSVPFSTDENGSFCVEYTTKGSGLLNPILTKGSEQIIELTNSGDVGKIVYRPEINYQVSINIKNVYSQGDTLRIFDNSNQILKMPYPFNAITPDTFLFTQIIYENGFQSPNRLDRNLLVRLGLNCRIDSGNYPTTFAPRRQFSYYKNLRACSGNIEKLEIEID